MTKPNLERSSRNFVTLWIPLMLAVLAGPAWGQARIEIYPPKPSCSKKIPWQVGIYSKRPDGWQICGGAQIDSKWILTAAHCVVDDTKSPPVKLDASDVRLFTSSTWRPEPDSPSLIAPLRIETNPDYLQSIESHDADIALIQIASSLPRDTAVMVASSEQTEDAYWHAGVRGLVAGWGTTSQVCVDQDCSPAPRLQEGEPSFVSRNACSANAAYQGKLTDRMVCAGAEGIDACKGDSGGALVVVRPTGEAMLVGVVSFGLRYACGVLGAPSVYARAASFANWISKTAGQLDALPKPIAITSCPGHQM